MWQLVERLTDSRLRVFGNGYLVSFVSVDNVHVVKRYNLSMLPSQNVDAYIFRNCNRKSLHAFVGFQLVVHSPKFEERFLNGIFRFHRQFPLDEEPLAQFKQLWANFVDYFFK